MLEFDPSMLEFDEYQMNQLKMTRSLADRLASRAAMLFHRKLRPVYVGTVSLEIGVGLKRTMIIIDAMVRAGHLRRLQRKELRAIDAPKGAFVYVLASERHIGWGYMP